MWVSRSTEGRRLKADVHPLDGEDLIGSARVGPGRARCRAHPHRNRCGPRRPQRGRGDDGPSYPATSRRPRFRLRWDIETGYTP